jgi:hypothetical protein
MTRTGTPSARPATEEIRPVRRGLRRALAAVAALALGAGLAVVGAAAPASAHTGDLKANAVCNTETGEYDVTYTLKLSSVPKGNTGSTKWRVGGATFEKTPTSAAGMDRGPIPSNGDETITLGTESLPGDTVGNGPWVYAYTVWSPDGYGKGSDGRIEKLAGDCDAVGPNAKKITFCHATGSDSNPYVLLTTSVNAFFNAGHIDHQDHRDIYPAFSYVKKGKTIEVPAQGDQSLLELGCKTPEQIAIPAAPTAQDECGIAEDRIITPADTDILTWTVTPVVGGKATAKVTIVAKGYVFSDGTTTFTEYTFPEYSFTNEPCVTEIPEPTIVDVVVTDQCGTDGDTFSGKPTTGVVWSYSPIVDNAATATATAQPGYVFTGGKTVVEILVNFTNVDCPPKTAVISALPIADDQCGVDKDAVIVPSNGEHYSWSQVSKTDTLVVVRATADEGYVFAADGDYAGGTTRDFSFEFKTEPCPELIQVPAQPASTDVCGVDHDAVTLPDDTEQIAWTLVGDPKSGSAKAVATAKAHYVFDEKGTKVLEFGYEFDQTECETPTLSGSTAGAVCDANTPWIVFDVVLNDPDGISTGHTAYLVLSDGTHTEKVELGPLGEDGTLQGRVLWPGAEVDEAGNPIAWPGWKQLPNGRWVVTDENFGWTHELTSATIEVNPELSIVLEYPPAASGCGPVSTPASTDDVTPIDNEGSGLASTGFAGGPLLYVAGGLVLAGAVVLVVTLLRRRKRA